MDPISCVASVFTIIGTANIVLQSIHRIKSIRKVDEAIDSLRSEVQAIRALLKDAHEVQKLVKRVYPLLISWELTDYVKAGCQSAINPYLKQAELKVKELEEIINTKFTYGSGKGPKFVRLRWVQSDVRIQGLQNDLGSIIKFLTIALATIIVAEQVHMQTSVKDIVHVTERISVDARQGNEFVCKRLDQQAKELSRLSAQVSKLHTDTDVRQSPKILIGSLHRGESSSPLPTGQALYTRENAMGVCKSRKSITQCSGLCPCCCHVKRRLNIGILTSITGSVSISYTGAQVKDICNQPYCRRGPPKAFNLTYFFPHWLLIQVVNILLSFDPAGRPSILIQTPCIRPDTSQIFHLAAAGDIEGMKTMFDRGLACPNDVSHTFGYSVLHVSAVHGWHAYQRLTST